MEATGGHLLRSTNFSDDKKRPLPAFPNHFRLLADTKQVKFIHLNIYARETKWGQWRPGETRGGRWRVSMTSGDLLETIGTGSCWCHWVPSIQGLVSWTLQPQWHVNTGAGVRGYLQYLSKWFILTKHFIQYSIQIYNGFCFAVDLQSLKNKYMKGLRHGVRLC